MSEHTSSTHERTMTPDERAQWRVREDQCAVLISARLPLDAACLLAMPCAKHAHLNDPTSQPTSHADGDALGRHVRRVWVQWAHEQDDPKPTWPVGWDDLPEPDRDVDRRIGQALFTRGVRHAQAHARTTAQAVGAPMTSQEMTEIAKAFERDKWVGEWNSLPTAIDRLLADRASLLDSEPT